MKTKLEQNLAQRRRDDLIIIGLFIAIHIGAISLVLFSPEFSIMTCIVGVLSFVVLCGLFWELKTHIFE